MQASSCLRPGPLLLAAGIILLAIEPVCWLVNTWIDPAYDSQGFLVAGLVGGLLLWSGTSSRVAATGDRRRALCLLVLTATVRLAGQVLGVNVVGALALVLDVYALGLLLAVERRRRPLSPGWLAVLFAWALPVERIVQRTLGFGLQQLAATAACGLLSLGPDPVRCEGVRILLGGRDVLVDLPCSGARGLLLLWLLFTALATLTRPRPVRALAGAFITVAAALAANSLRITLLALGLAYPAAVGGIAVLETPWHEGIGIIALVVGAVPVLIWARRCPGIGWAGNAVFRPAASTDRNYAGSVTSAAGTLYAGLGFLISAAIIVVLPTHPVDVAHPLEAIHLPATVAGLPARYGVLSAQEQAYFTRYGGGAARATYGPYAVLVVTTSAPLRHLHAPDECLAGGGQQVRYRGARYRGLPTALYRSVDPQGRVWRVAVTFVSDRGEQVTSVAEAVWRWLYRPGGVWTMVQRIAPWGLPESELDSWDAAVARALDLSYPAAGDPARQPFNPSVEEIPL